MTTTLVTGGAGFIGSNLVGALLARGERVVCVDNFDDTYDPALKEAHIQPFLKNPNFVLCRVDIRRFEDLAKVFDTEKPQRIAHLAAKADTRAAVKDPRSYLSNNVEGTLNVLECARDYGIAMTVIASSGSVYGNSPHMPWREDEHTDTPLSAYGASKKMTEMLAYTYHHNFGMNVVCLRYFNVYGENNRPSMVPYKWAEAFLKHTEVELSGDGERKRDFTYVGDVVDATILALDSSLSYEVLNIAGSSPHSLKELFETFSKVVGATPPIHARESHRASVAEMYGDNSKAKKLLDWEPSVGLEEGVERLVAWFRTDRL